MADQLYKEALRPQFHFTAAKNWINDPNGLVYYDGTYHLFFQHNPDSIEPDWYNRVWGHAVSTDLVHWEQLEQAIFPDELGAPWSGSAVVDWKNTAGFQAANNPALVIFYTSAQCSPKKSTQSMAYSADKGKTWIKYKENPIVGYMTENNRDPKVVWHEPTNKWVMAIFMEDDYFALMGSENLKKWYKLCDICIPMLRECPDFFEMPVLGEPINRKWIFWAAAGKYVIGSFDGENFTAETEVIQSEYGNNGYAAQVWSDTPNDRKVQISWMADGKYPLMPFNQQLSFPVELTLKRCDRGLRIYRLPVKEIELLYGREFVWQNYLIKESNFLMPSTCNDILDICVEVDLSRNKLFDIIIGKVKLQYNSQIHALTCFDKVVELSNTSNVVKLRLLTDRSSLEVFVDDGRVLMSFCYLPQPMGESLQLYSQLGEAKIISMTVHELNTMWK